MKLDFVALDRLSISPTNMRYRRAAPDVTDILPSIRQRGVLQPVIVRPDDRSGGFEIVAGARRFTAARIVADERIAADGEPDPMPCAILETSDDADAVEASLIENLARRDADEVTQWVTFTRLVKQGRSPEEIALTFGLPDLAVSRILALGNLLPRIRTLYAKDAIDRVSIRHLTLASKRQQHAWLALVDNPDARAPVGATLKSWLLGGQSITTEVALFDIAESGLATVTDLFGETGYFADAAAFWRAQDEAVAAREQAYLEAGWSAVTIVPPSDYFQTWEYDKRAKRQGGRVYIDVRATGEVVFHEGYISRREAAREARGFGGDAKPARPEITAAATTYVDLHRHAAVRAALLDHGGVALRLMVAHVIVGSPLWTVRREPQAARDDATRASVAASPAEARFAARRRLMLTMLDMDPDRDSVTGGNGDDFALVRLFLRLLALCDSAVLELIAVAMGETLLAGGAAVAAVGEALGVDMADDWRCDTAFLELVRDKEVLGAMVAEVAGEAVASANAKETGKTLKRILADHLAGDRGRPKIEGWVPRWMRFPPAAYTARGGVGPVRAQATLDAAKAEVATPDSGTEDAPAAPPDPDTVDDTDQDIIGAEHNQLAA